MPQLWCPYKEVLEYYDRLGLRVPDDVTILWPDDNWGNLRRLPTAEERKNSGGAGIYYHFDYVGGPRNYKWINTNPLPKVWEQMTQALENRADRIWIVNVGDLKPLELPISFFMKLAWDGKKLHQDQVAQFTRDWAAQQFGSDHANEIAELLAKYRKICRPPQARAARPDDIQRRELRRSRPSCCRVDGPDKAEPNRSRRTYRPTSRMPSSSWCSIRSKLRRF